MSQQRILKAKKVLSLLGCIRKTLTSRLGREVVVVRGEVSLPLFSALGPPVQERHKHAGATPVKVLEDDCLFGLCSTKGGAERLLSPEKRRLSSKMLSICRNT